MPSQSNEATDLPLNQQLHARYPYLSNDPIPTERITSSDYFEEEREAIFARSWLQVAMTSDLPKPGSFFVRDIPPLSTSVIIPRDRSGSLHAVNTFCTHRGLQLSTGGTQSH